MKRWENPCFQEFPPLQPPARLSRRDVPRRATRFLEGTLLVCSPSVRRRHPPSPQPERQTSPLVTREEPHETLFSPPVRREGIPSLLGLTLTVGHFKTVGVSF